MIALIKAAAEKLRSLLPGDSKPKVKRSPHWPAVRAQHLRFQPDCVVCRSRKNVEVHHVVPVHVDPSLELDPVNLITLCEAKGANHHLLFGHLGDWPSWNALVKLDAATWREKIRTRPYKEAPAP